MRLNAKETNAVESQLQLTLDQPPRQTHQGRVSFIRSAATISIAFVGLFLAPASGTADIQTITQGLSADISPYGKVSLPANINLRSADTRFGRLTASISLNYSARTSIEGGGAITIQANSDFAPSGGPSISDVAFSCSGATLGASCAGNQNLSTSTQASLVLLPAGSCTGGGGVCSAQDPTTVLVNLSVPSKPVYKTGNYSAQLTLTISTL
jgi:hypothetical protein